LEENQNIGGMVSIADEYMDISQLLGRARALALPPKSTPKTEYKLLIYC